MTQRFILYSHDTYGLGHLRRNTTIAEALTQADPGVEVLLLSGSPRSASFSLPPRTDVVQLPSITKSASGAYIPRRLTSDLEHIVEVRSAVIDATVRSYRPDVIIVDHAPTGMGGELLLALKNLDSHQRKPRLVLGLREVIDDQAVVDQKWRAGGEWDVLGLYDDVLVYGDERVLSTASELDLQNSIGQQVHHVGYCGPVQQSHDLRTTEQPPLVVVTVGGGGDGHEICDRYLDYLEQQSASKYRSVIVTGPLMSSRRRARLMQRASSCGSKVEVVAFHPAMRDLLNSAEAVVSMAGYNSTVELLAGGIPALVVPRTTPRLEQFLRAQRLQELTHLESCDLDHMTVALLDDFLGRSVGRPRHPVTLDLGGAARVADMLVGSASMAAVSARA